MNHAGQNSDHERMAAVARGDLSSMDEIYQNRHRTLFRFFFRLTNRQATAEGLVHEVFLRMIRSAILNLPDGRGNSGRFRSVSGSVSASTVNGSLTVSLDRVTPDKPMSFSSLNGKVDVTLPADAKARLRIKTTNGAVYSDFDVKMEPDSSKPVIEDGRGQAGKYRIGTDRGVYGSINGGGPEYSFQTMNGSILIHKK